MILIKLGGSVITNKEREYTFRKDVTERLIAEITAGTDEDMIIVHGGGSFGHPGAEKYKLNTENPEQMAKGTAEVQLSMRRMNSRILEMMLDAGLHGVSLPGGLVTTFYDGELEMLDVSMFERYLELNMVPVAFGDVAFDEARGVTICSGDDIMHGLSSLVTKAYFVTDVDGIFKNGELMETFREDMLPLQKNDIPKVKNYDDVTGSMERKVEKMLEMSDNCRTFVVNGTVEGRLQSLLEGKETPSTEVKR